MRTKVIIPRSKWPTRLRHPVVKGVCLFQCIDGDVSLKGQGAHAHLSSARLPGWICFRYRYLLEEKHYFTHLHELAHLLTDQAHTPEWRETLSKLGGTCYPYMVKHRLGKQLHFRGYHLENL